MNATLFVGNVSFSSTPDELRTAFSEIGEVSAVRIISDRETGRSKGFAFVEMNSPGDLSTAIERLDGIEHLGRKLVVREAAPRPVRH